MTICSNYNNSMIMNGDVSKVTTPGTEDNVVESEHYDSEFEQLNDNYGHRSDLSSVCTRPKLSNDHSSQIVGIDHCVNTSDRNVENAVRRKQKSQRMSYKPMIKKVGPHAMVPAALMQQSVVDRWETAQLALGEAHSQNVHLQRQLQECRAELRTVQRQCKLQSARLNKAIGQEADLPRIVDRLTADVRSLQIRLREKTTQCEASQRKVNELQHRILVLEKECGEKQNVILPDDIALRKQANKMEEVLAELNREKKKVASVQHQLALAKKSQKHQLALANEQVRELRRVCQDLEFQLAERTQALQEKTKLLELQNIYSQRLPKCIPTHLPPPEVSAGLDPSEQYSLRERGRHVTKPERLIQPIPGDRSSRKMKVTLPFEQPPSRLPHSHNNPTVAVPEVVCTQVIAERSDVTPCPNEMTFEEIENRVVDTASDSNPGLPTTTFVQIPPEQVQQDEDSLSKQTERNEESVQDASTTCITEHVSSPKVLQQTGDEETVLNQTSQHSDVKSTTSQPMIQLHNTGNVTPTPSKSETVAEELTHLKAKMEEMYAENKQLRLAAVGQNTPLDSDQPVSEPDGSLPNDSPLPTVEQIDLERREEERKARLLQTLDLLDRTDSHTDFQLSANNHTEKFRSARSEENNKTKEPQREITGDFGKLNKRREQELWDELFGPESGVRSPKTNSNSQTSRAHAGLSAKTGVRQAEPNKSRMTAVKQDAQQRRDMFGRIKPRAGEHKQPALNHGKGMKQASLLPAIPGLTEPVETHPRRMHPKYAQQRSMPDEDDSDFEEFHA